MEAPSDLKAALWGAAGGAAVLTAVGLMWDGWVTQRTAEAKARQLASGQVVSTLARTCVDKFRQQADVAARLTQLKASSSSQQGLVIENGGWATMQGARAPDSAVARACAEVLAEDP
jgi:hypothetical protein